MSRLISRAELSRLAKVSGAAITKACKHQLGPACVGRRIDLDHAATVNYLAGKGAAPTEPLDPPKNTTDRPTARRRKPGSAASHSPAPTAPIVSPLEGADFDIEAYADRTLRELTEMFGTETKFKDWLDARKKIADIREKDLKNAETEGHLIDRELVKTHVFGAIDAALRKLLNDSPKTIARRLYSAANSGVPLEESERMVREIIGSQLKPVKVHAARALRDA
jgi:hypothetical protein